MASCSLYPPTFLSSHKTGSNVKATKVKTQNKSMLAKLAAVAIEGDGVTIYDIQAQTVISSIKLGSSFSPSCIPVAFMHWASSSSSPTPALFRKTFTSHSSSIAAGQANLLMITERLNQDGSIADSPEKRFVALNSDAEAPGSSVLLGLELVDFGKGAYYIVAFTAVQKSRREVVLLDDGGIVIQRLTIDSETSPL
ncbi:hypothetical protein BT69DRAFT_589236 [Atractiella rhizophila]|nr:hypothetical protein BT69DRAFT_589236 [Atractiella rhizophila]